MVASRRTCRDRSPIDEVRKQADPRVHLVEPRSRRSVINARKLPPGFGDGLRTWENSARKQLLDSLVRQPEHFGSITHREMSVLD